MLQNYENPGRKVWHIHVDGACGDTQVEADIGSMACAVQTRLSSPAWKSRLSSTEWS